MSTVGSERPRSAGWKVVGIFLAGALFGAASAVQAVPNFKAAAVATDGAVDSSGGIVGTTTGTGAVTGGSGKGGQVAGTGSTVAGAATTGGGGGTLPPSRPGLECAPGKNGGSTDTGVTADEVRMATTVVDSGIGAAFLRDVRYAMEAVRNKINRGGGICGRSLSIEYRDDGWNAQTGAQYLRNFIQQGIFAIPVGPSSEGLRIIIDSGDIDAAKVPVVGTDGMLIDQYEKVGGGPQPWVWPVAAATVSSARIMAREAYKQGARKFSIVFDKNYRFGVEAAEAFNAEVRNLTGKDVPGYNKQYSCQESFCGVQAGSQSYSGEVATFQEGDFVALFLEPQTALVWMGDPNTRPASQVDYGAAQPLFTREFAASCKAKCDQMSVWTGFKPPIESYANDPAVREYVNDLKSAKPDADEFNAFAQGGYVGMLLMVEAMKKVGPDLTRERLKAALDSTCLKSGLTLQPKICFSPNSRFANTTMQAFVIQYKGTFGGWRAGPIVRD